MLGATEPEAVNVHTNTGVISEKITDVHYIHFSDDSQTMVLTKADGKKTSVAIVDIRKITFGEQIVNALESTTQPAHVRFTLVETEEIYVDCTDGIKALSLYNINGQQVYAAQYTNTPNQVVFSVASLPQGVYIAKVNTPTASVSQKLTIH